VDSFSLGLDWCSTLLRTQTPLQIAVVVTAADLPMFACTFEATVY